MNVIAKQGRSCPRQDPRDAHITDAQAVQVPDTEFYRRLVADGSLSIVVEKTETIQPTSKRGKK